MADIFNMTDTWNDGATTFTAIKMNVTDTASASGSNLLDLQLGGASNFTVGKDLVEKKRGTNAQSFNIYNTYTDASNYERGFVGWSSNVFTIASQKSGTGSSRAVEIKASGNGDVIFKSEQSSYGISLRWYGEFGPDFNTTYGILGNSTRRWNKLWVNEIDAEGAVNLSASSITMGNLPTTDPAVSGRLWNDAGTLKVSAG